MSANATQSTEISQVAVRLPPSGPTSGSPKLTLNFLWPTLPTRRPNFTTKYLSWANGTQKRGTTSSLHRPTLQTTLMKWLFPLPTTSSAPPPPTTVSRHSSCDTSEDWSRTCRIPYSAPVDQLPTNIQATLISHPDASLDLLRRLVPDVPDPLPHSLWTSYPPTSRPPSSAIRTHRWTWRLNMRTVPQPTLSLSADKSHRSCSRDTVTTAPGEDT
jgi:hypothetical protein